MLRCDSGITVSAASKGCRREMCVSGGIIAVEPTDPFMLPKICNFCVTEESSEFTGTCRFGSVSVIQVLTAVVMEVTIR